MPVSHHIWLRLASAAALLLALAAGCSSTPRRPPSADAGPGSDGARPTTCAPGGPPRICLGNQEITCNPDGSEAGRRNCPETGQVCAPEIGCAACVPNRGQCLGNDVQRCRADGSGWDTVASCDPAAGAMCDAVAVACVSPCDQAAASNSYIGCEYWPVATSNTQLDRTAFSFAVVVSNPQPTEARITITRQGSTVATRMVAPGALETIELPWVEELQGEPGSEASALVTGGAYRLTSTLPVTVYQFNPLEYRSGSSTFSYTNDASLLLPSHVLSPNYVITSRPTMMLEQVTIDPFFGGEDVQRLSSPAFFAVVATEDGGTSVRITFAADVRASLDGRVRGFRRGESGTFELQQGDVLQIVADAPPSCDRSGGMDMPDPLTRYYYCTVGPQWDPSGTEIRASRNVAVIAGHNCAFVPFNRWACDHLEENLFPEESWGRDAIVSVTQPIRGEPNIVRILSGRDGNMITFDPPVRAPTVLHRGQILEIETRDHFRILATEAIEVAQYMVGQDYGGMGMAGMGGEGDPSMSLAIPTEQYRNSYAFLAPTTYARSFVNVTAPMGASITLDGNPVTGFMPVGGTGYGVARVMVGGGAHEIDGDQPFGIVVYGFGSYTSYLYPGGLDLEEINIPF